MSRTWTSRWGAAGPRSPSLLLMTFLSIINPAFDLLFGYLCQCDSRNLIRQVPTSMAFVLYPLLAVFCPGIICVSNPKDPGLTGVLFSGVPLKASSHREMLQRAHFKGL